MFGFTAIRQSRLLNDAVQMVGRSNTIAEIAEALRQSARAIADADGVTVIQREGDMVAYIGEDAISPLWTGRRFPLRLCISGMAILARAPIIIPDIMQDRRVPMNAYVGTFVRSMVVIPIGHGDPVMAMGAYWRHAGTSPAKAADRLVALAASASDRIAELDTPPRVAA